MIEDTQREPGYRVGYTVGYAQGVKTARAWLRHYQSILPNPLARVIAGQIERQLGTLEMITERQSAEAREGVRNEAS